MESIPQDKILRFRPDTMVSIRKQYNLDKPGEMDQVIDLLDNWMKKQNHFTKIDYSREYLERSIILLKGSVERAKKQTDRLCTLKTLMPKYFENYNPRNDFKDARGYYVNALLPVLTDDNYRVYSGKFLRNGLSSTIFFDCFRLGAVLCEYIKGHDYCNGFVGVLDYRGINMIDFISAINLVEFHQIITILMEGYDMRIKGIHILTDSKAIEKLVVILKKFLGTKVGSRILVHTKLETLHEHMSKDILPEEYGGYERSIKVLHDEWIDVLSTEDNVKYTKEMFGAGIKNSYRQTEKFNEMYTGMTGTFRTLNVD